MFNSHQINHVHAGFLALSILWIAASCSQNKFTHYEGYVYREGRPLPHIEVSDSDVPQRKTYTDERGFFRLDKQKDAVSSIFMVRENDHVIDSIDLIRTAGGEQINYYFTNKRSDTLFITDADPNILTIKLTEIDSIAFQLAAKSAGTRKLMDKITDFKQVKERLAGVVDFEESEGYLGVKRIHFRNGKTSDGFDELQEFVFVAYFPADDVLLLEGGHTTDVSFNLSSGEGTDEAGNPELAIASPNEMYRLNKVFEGQQCFDHFIQKRTQNTYRKILGLNDLFSKQTGKWLCVIENEFWTNDTTMYFGLVTAYNERQGNEYIYYRLEIKDMDR